MKKFQFFLLAVMLGCCTVHADSSLDSLFNALRPLASSATEVKYTGMYDGNIPGFMIQRGYGNGWTEGLRLNCIDIKPEKAEEIFNTFDTATEGKALRSGSQRAYYNESERVVYLCNYQEDTNTLQLLKASVDDEICVPYDWYSRDFYDGSPEQLKFQLPTAEWVAALAKLYTELKYNYVFYDRFKGDIDRVYNEIFPQMAQVTDNYEALRLLNRFIASCHDGHTYVYAVGVIEQPVCSPFTTRLIGDRVYIDRVESTELQQDGMQRGMEVVAVNGVPVGEYADSALRPFVGSSTPQWTDYRVFDKYGLSTGRKGSPLNLTLTNDHDTLVINHQTGRAKRDLPAAPDRFQFSKIDGNIGLLRITDFQSEQVTEMFDRVYNDILATDALIIDIRGNGGGNSGYANYIARHFSADSIRSDSWRSPTYTPAFASWGYERSWHEEPSVLMPPIREKEPYLKPLVILIDRGTFSAAEDFAALFKAMGRAVFVGNPSGGSTGNGVRVQLNSAVAANICSKHDRMADGTEFVGIGILPDVSVDQTPQSYFSPSGGDAFIKAAISQLKGQLKP